MQNASHVSGTEEYRLTDDSPWQRGGVWHTGNINLRDSFVLTCFVYLGSQLNGADGLAFVLQKSGVQVIGVSGGNLGLTGINPSFGIEFDTFRNIDYDDPPYDHISFVRDGNLNHSLERPLAGPVSISESGGSVKDGKKHSVRLQWTAQTQELSLYFDESLRLQTRIDLIRDIFYNEPEVWWGFTAATGTLSNVHSVFLTSSSMQVERCIPEVYIPSVFTPNNDAQNDTFNIITGDKLDMDLQIYNSTGVLVFHSTDQKTGWPGTNCLPGTYAFILSYRCRRNVETERFVKRGSVLLIR